jgi:hypothetical protein
METFRQSVSRLGFLPGTPEIQVRSITAYANIVQTGSEVHPTSYKMGAGGKAAGA